MGTDYPADRQSNSPLVYTLHEGRPLVLVGIALELELLRLLCTYPGHRYEELGDEYDAELAVTWQGQRSVHELDWWEVQEGTLASLRIGPYRVEIVDCGEKSVGVRVVRDQQIAGPSSRGSVDNDK